MKECTELRANKVWSVCPHCENEEEWLCNPRGAETACDECGKKYKIHDDADVEYY